jgi:hypothetical protein
MHFLHKKQVPILWTYMWVLQNLANVVTLIFWDTCASTLLCGKNPITIFNAYSQVLQMCVNKHILVTNDNYMVHKAYG